MKRHEKTAMTYRRVTLDVEPICNHYISALRDALAAVAYLRDAGIKPLSIRLDGRRPVITIEPPGLTTFLHGSTYMRVRMGDTVRTTLAAPCYGCQVEWQVTTPRDTQQVATHG